MWGRVGLVMLVVIAMVAGPASAQADFVPRELVVRFADAVPADGRADVRASVRAVAAHSRDGGRLQLLRFEDEAAAQRALERLERSPQVRWAERNPIWTVQAVPADPLFPQQWGLSRIRAPEAWAAGRGSGVKVGHLDSGVRAEHPDLAGQVEDVADFVDGDGAPQDEHGHGTATAGIISARADDAGVVGVAPDATLLVARVVDARGSAYSISGALSVLIGHGAKVVNISLGGEYSRAVAEEIYNHPEVLVIASAGNAGRDMDATASWQFPCAYLNPNVMCVSATDASDKLAGFSNRGPEMVDLAAPGVDILTTAAEPEHMVDEDFEQPLTGRWTPAGDVPWGRTASYVAEGSSGLTTGPVPEGGMNGVLTLDETFSPESWDAREQCWVDVHVRTDLAGDDEFRIDYQTSGGTWYPMKLWTGDVDEHAVLTPSLHGYPRLRLSLSASAASAGRAGAQIDELKVLCSGENMTAGGWEPISGTSASTPFVSGVAALVRSARPELEAAGVKAALMCGAQPITSLAGTSVSGARLDARGAIDAGLLPGAPRSSARLESQGFTSADYPTGVAEHPGGGYVVALSEQHKLVRVFADGRREVIAGTGENASSGDGGPATAAALARPGFVAVRQDGSILFTEWSRIREIDTKGTIRTLAGNGGFNYVPDGAQATSGSIATPEALLADADGGFTFTQSFSPQGRVRRVDADGVIHTVAGGGAAAPVEGGPAKGVQLRDPFGLARLADGSLLVSERTGHRIRRIAPDGTLHTWAGDGIPGISGDGGPRSAARLAYPRALATSDDGTVYAMASVVRAFTPDGRVERVAGGLHGSPAGVDGVPALDASLEVRAVSVVGGRVFLSAHSLFTLSQEREPYAPYPPTCADPREPSPDPDPAPSPSPSPDPSPDPSPSPTTPPSHSPSPEPEGPPAPPARSPFGQLTPPVAVPEPGKVTEALRLGVRVQPASSRTAQRRGLRIAISCTPACHVRIAATVNGRRIASTAPLRPSGRRAMRLKLPRARARTRVRLSVSAVTVAGAQANRVVTTVLR